MIITLNDVENEYRSEIQKALASKKPTVEFLLEISPTLFQKIKIKDISEDDKSSDMLLYQYGIYNWGNEWGEHFSFDITRQFIMPPGDEPYQLSLSLIYEQDAFKHVGHYDCWSMDYADIEKFISHVKATDGFKEAQKHKPKEYQLRFSQC